MFRLLAIFAVLFLGAAAAVAFLPSPPHTIAPQSVAAEAANPSASSGAARSDVRVVYPALNASTNVALPAPAAMAVPVVAAATVVPTPVQPLAPKGAMQDAVMPADAAAPATSQSLNLNTASIDALDQLPGAGHIGRTIARHRPYRSVEDLLTKRVVRKSVYDRIKDQVAAQ